LLSHKNACLRLGRSEIERGGEKEEKKRYMGVCQRMADWNARTTKIDFIASHSKVMF
jgi:hypothetical protein